MEVTSEPCITWYAVLLSVGSEVQILSGTPESTAASLFRGLQRFFVPPSPGNFTSVMQKWAYPKCATAHILIVAGKFMPFFGTSEHYCLIKSNFFVERSTTLKKPVRSTLIAHMPAKVNHPTTPHASLFHRCPNCSVTAKWFFSYRISPSRCMRDSSLLSALRSTFR